MKRIFCIALCFAVVIVHAQQNHSLSYLGTKTLYTPLGSHYTNPPKGYNAVFINYVGRHGARHLTKDVSTYYLFTVINKADSFHQLTIKGQQLKNMIILLDKIESGKVKSISEEGKNELQQIASRLYENNKNIFEENHINLRYTKEKRTLQSADAFIKGLKEKTTLQPFQQNEDNENLRFYDLSESYTNYKNKGNWIDSLVKLKTNTRYQQVVSAICSRFFNKGFIENNKIDEEEIISNIFSFATIVYSLQSEIKENGVLFKDVEFASLLSQNELQCLSQIDKAEEYYTKGPAINNSGVQVKIAVPLLIDFIKTTDDFIATKKTNVQLRFCHAETILPFAAMMNITSAATVAKNISQINTVWRSENIAPLSGNVQWILYYNSTTKNYRIKFLLNEKEVAISGLKPKTFPYYEWNNVKEFYLNKLHLLNADINTNALEYLQSLK